MRGQPPGPSAAVAWLEDAINGRRHAVRGGMLPLAEVLREFPGAALHGDDGGTDDEPRRAGAGAD